MVYKAPDEFSAITIREILKGQGISATIRSTQIPWYDNVMQRATRVWGEILVPEERKRGAERIIKEYLTTVKKNQDLDPAPFTLKYFFISSKGRG